MADHAHTVVTLKGGKVITLPAAMITNMANVEALLKLALPGPTKCISLPNVSATEFESALTVARGGVSDCTEETIKVLGIHAPQMAPHFRISPQKKLAEADLVDGNNLILQTTLCGAEDDALKDISGQYSTYPPICGIPGKSRYVAAVLKVPEVYVPPANIEFPLKCANTETVDAIHTMVLKVTFPKLNSPPPTPVGVAPEPQIHVPQFSWCPHLFERLFERAELVIADNILDKKPLSLNNLVAAMQKLWPTYSNFPREFSPFTATVPLMLFGDSPDAPILASAWRKHGAKIVLRSVAPIASLIRKNPNPLEDTVAYAATLQPITFELFVEGVLFHDKEYASAICSKVEGADVPQKQEMHAKECPSCAEHCKLKQAASVCHAGGADGLTQNAETKKEPKTFTLNLDALDVIEATRAAQVPVPDPDRALPTPTKNVVLSQLQYLTVNIDQAEKQEQRQTITIPSEFKSPATGLVMFVEAHLPPIGDPLQYPIQMASLRVNSHNVLTYDCSDLYEWNWLKTSLSGPANMSAALMPFSRLFNQRGRSAVLNLGRGALVELVLDLDPQLMARKLVITVASFAHNSIQYTDHSCKKCF